MDFPLLVVGLVALGLAAIVLFSYARRRRETMERAWSTAARAVGGTVEFPPPFLAGSQIGMKATVDGVDIVAEGRSQVGTWLRAEAPEAGKLRLRIRPGSLSPMARALGFRDVGTGDPVFDTRFVLATDDEGAARSWLTPDVRRRVARSSYEIALENGKVTASGPPNRIEMDARVLEAVLRAVAAVASPRHAGGETPAPTAGTVDPNRGRP